MIIHRLPSQDISNRFAGRKFFVLAALLFIALPHDVAHADDNITADRPGISDSSVTVGPNVFQFETGLQNDFGRNHERDIEFPSLLRFGISDGFEARIEGNVFSASQSGAGSDRDTSHGLDPASAGAKYQFYGSRESGPTLGLLARIYPPSGSSEFRSRRVATDLRLAGDATAGHTVFTVNVGAAIYEDSDTRQDFAAAIGAATITQNITDAFAIFIDSGLQQPERRNGGMGFIADTGLTYLLSPDTQLDLETGTTVAGDTGPSIFWGFGVSCRFFLGKKSST